jgi:hypothetical protein
MGELNRIGCQRQLLCFLFPVSSRLVGLVTRICIVFFYLTGGHGLVVLVTRLNHLFHFCYLLFFFYINFTFYI